MSIPQRKKYGKRKKNTTQSSKIKSEKTRRNSRKRTKSPHSSTEASNSAKPTVQSHFECDLCGKWFTSKRNLIEHLRSGVHTEKKKFSCQNCGELVPVRTKRALKPELCIKCDRKSRKRSTKIRPDSRKRTKSHPHSPTEASNSAKPTVQLHFQCDLCGKCFTQRKNLIGHLRSGVHSEKKKFSCQNCGELVPVRTKRALNPQQCLKCERKFRKISITNTYQNHQSIICDICGRIFSSKYTLDVHQCAIHDRRRPFNCNTCGKTFGSKTILDKHIKVHTSEKPYKCTICDRSFRQNSSRKKHELLHEKKARYFCAYCDKQYCRKKLLYYHILAHLHEMKSQLDSTSSDITHHEQTQPATKSSDSNLPLVPQRSFSGKKQCCELCGQHFATNDGLNRHIRVLHEGQKPFQCEHCDKCFGRKDELTRHAVIHSSLKQFKCSICRQPFKHRRNLVQHESAVHKNIKFPCSYCNMTFSRTARLAMHMRMYHPLELNESSERLVDDDYSTGLSKSKIPDVRAHSINDDDNPPVENEVMNHFPAETSLSMMYASHQSEFVAFVYNSLKQHELSNSSAAGSSKSTIPEDQWNPADFLENTLAQFEVSNHFAADPLEATITEEEWLTPSVLNHASMESEIPDYTMAELPKPKMSETKDHLLNVVPNSTKLHKTKKHSPAKASKSKTLEVQSPFSAIENNPFNQPEVKDLLQPFPCDLCDRRYKTKCNLNRHKRTSHTAEKPFVCTTCGKAFVLVYEMKRHMRGHTSDRPYKCTTCGKGFKRASNRSEHERTMHEDGRYGCANCDKKFSRREKLIFHLQTKHMPELGKQFTCDVCGKSFAFKRILNDHKVVHISERPYKCSTCDLWFKDERNRRKHEQRIHDERECYYCAYCNGKYRWKQTLERHIQVSHSYPVAT